MTIFLDQCSTCADCAVVSGADWFLTGTGVSPCGSATYDRNSINVSPVDTNVASVTVNGVPVVNLERGDPTFGPYRAWTFTLPGEVSTCVGATVVVKDTLGNTLTQIGAVYPCVGCPDDCKITGVEEIFFPDPLLDSFRITLSPAQAYLALFLSQDGHPSVPLTATCGQGIESIDATGWAVATSTYVLYVYSPSGGAIFTEPIPP